MRINESDNGLLDVIDTLPDAQQEQLLALGYERTDISPVQKTQTPVREQLQEVLSTEQSEEQPPENKPTRRWSVYRSLDSEALPPPGKSKRPKKRRKITSSIKGKLRNQLPVGSHKNS